MNTKSYKSLLKLLNRMKETKKDKEIIYLVNSEVMNKFKDLSNN